MRRFLHFLTASSTPSPDPPGPEPTGHRLAVDTARDQLAAELAAVDSDDIKSLGYLGAAVGGIAATLAIWHPTGRKDLLLPYWWSPAAAFSVAFVLLMFSLRKREYPSGPNPLQVYNWTGPTAYLDLTVEIVRMKLGVTTQRRSRGRRWTYRVALFALVIGGVLSGMELAGVLWFHAGP